MHMLAEVIRTKIEMGLLPDKAPEKLIGEHGDGSTCSVCDAPIFDSEVQWRFVARDKIQYRFHVGCHIRWEAECLKRLPRHG